MNVAMAVEPPAGRRAWLRVLWRYLLFVTAANLLWEVAQLPLYTIATTGSGTEIAFAIAHCTAGDLIIAALSLALALAVLGGAAWPARRFLPVAISAVAIGVAYAVFSEWLNVAIRASWAYTDRMPLVPPLGTGLAPLAQWIVVPALGFVWTRRMIRESRDAPSLPAFHNE